jgi:hypothetical protein
MDARKPPAVAYRTRGSISGGLDAGVRLPTAGIVEAGPLIYRSPRPALHR